MNKKKQRHYVNNPDFYQAICDYKDALKNKPSLIVPKYIGECIMQICNKLSNRPNFSGYTYKDEMIDEAIEACFKGIGSFNPEKTNNPFAYFTQIAWNAFLQQIKREQKQEYIKRKLAQQHIFLGDRWDNSQSLMNEASDAIIEAFENRLTKQKKSGKLVGIEKFAE